MLDEFLIGGGCPRCGTRDHNHTEDCPYNFKNQFDEITNELKNKNQTVELQGGYMKDKVYFAKVEPSAIIPSKREEDAGYDFYACFKGNAFTIEPFKPTLIPTGIAWASSSKYDLNFKNERGSIGTKGLIALCGLIDSGFRNEILFCVVNINDKPLIISKTATEFIKGEDYDIYPAGKAIAQGKIEIVPDVEVVEIPYEELLEMKSERGLGMLGDSGK